MTAPSTPLTPPARQGNWMFANSLGLLVLRFALGWVFIFTGAQKLFGAFDGMGMTNWIHVMEFMKLPLLPPAAWAWMSACGEFFGGVLLVLGLLTRLSAINIVVIMWVAIQSGVGKNGFLGMPAKVAPGEPPGAMYVGYAFNFALIAMAVALLLAGAGLISLDALIFKRSLWARGPQPLDQPVRRPDAGN